MVVQVALGGYSSIFVCKCVLFWCLLLKYFIVLLCWRYLKLFCATFHTVLWIPLFSVSDLHWLRGKYFPAQYITEKNRKEKKGREWQNLNLTVHCDQNDPIAAAALEKWGSEVSCWLLLFKALPGHCTKTRRLPKHTNGTSEPGGSGQILFLIATINKASADGDAFPCN